MNRCAAAAAAIVAICWIPASSFAQVGRPSAEAVPTELMGCVAGGNLQPVEQPLVLEPAEPFVLVDVVRRDANLRLVSVPTRYEITGIEMTPWLGMRVRVEGVLVEPATTNQAGGAKALPQIRAVRATSIWGTCPSRPAWEPLSDNRLGVRWLARSSCVRLASAPAQPFDEHVPGLNPPPFRRSASSRSDRIGCFELASTWD
jgi:hypothetical protein